MRKLLILVLLVGAFYGGYELGRRPGAPDLTPYAKKGYVCAHDISRRVARWASAEWDQINAAPADQGIGDAYNGTARQED